MTRIDGNLRKIRKMLELLYRSRRTRNPVFELRLPQKSITTYERLNEQQFAEYVKTFMERL